MRAAAAVLIVLALVSYATAGTPDPVAPVATSVACPDCPPITTRTYEYQDTQRVVQVPRVTERHIIPRVTEVVEYVDQEVVVTDPEQVICACPETVSYAPPVGYAQPMTVATGRGVVDPVELTGMQKRRLRRALFKAYLRHHKNDSRQYYRDGSHYQVRAGI